MKWQTLQISKNNINDDNGKAVQISMPHNSEYDGYCFWHPKKLVRDGLNKGAVAISFTDEFTFKLVKMGKGKWNKYRVISELVINSETLINQFEIMNENITQSKKETASYLTIQEPEKVTNIKVNINSELLND